MLCSVIHHSAGAKSPDPFKYFNMPILEKARNKQGANNTENTIIQMYNQGLAKFGGMYDKTLQRLKKEGKII